MTKDNKETIAKILKGYSASSMLFNTSLNEVLSYLEGKGFAQKTKFNGDIISFIILEKKGKECKIRQSDFSNNVLIQRIK